MTKKFLLYTLPALAVAIFPVFFLYGQNASEADPFVALRCVVLFALEGLAAYLLSLLLTQSASKAAIVAGIMLILANNFKPIKEWVQSWLPNMKYWHILFLCLLAVGHVIWFLNWFCKEELTNTLAGVLGLVVTGLCVVNLCTGIPGIIAYQKVVQSKQNSSIIAGEWDKSLPNFYYIIFDEYGGYDATKQYYGKDSSEDIAFFQDLGFNVSENSYSGTGNTLIETANLFNLNYVVQANGTNAEAAELRWNPLFFQLLQERGYLIQGIGSEAVQYYGLCAAYDVKQGQAETEEGKSFQELLIEKTLFYPLLQKKDMYFSYRAEQLESLNFFQEKIDTTQKGQFFFLHINCPHMPFVFDAKGNALSAADSANWGDKDIYIGQREYMTWWMKRIAKNLVEQDPDSIIVFQSDHSFRGGNQLNDLSLELCCNILNNVYYRGNVLDIQGKTSINTLRTILNALFDMNYEMVSPPEGMFTK